jgi:hypothetical protein
VIGIAWRHGGVKGGSVAERVRVRDRSSREGSRLLRTVRRDAGSAVTACRTNYGLMDSTEDVEPCCPVATTPACPPLFDPPNLATALCSVDRSRQSVQPA